VNLSSLRERNNESIKFSSSSEGLWLVISEIPVRRIKVRRCSWRCYGCRCRRVCFVHSWLRTLAPPDKTVMVSFSFYCFKIVVMFLPKNQLFFSSSKMTTFTNIFYFFYMENCFILFYLKILILVSNNIFWV